MDSGVAEGGVIGRANPPTLARASGVWTLDEVFDARVDNLWPIADIEAIIAALDIGDEAFGGFFAGIIDTIKHSSDIDPNDTRQNGRRYALFVSPEAIGEPSSLLNWRTSTTEFAQARTRWDGLYVTDLIINNETLSEFPIYEFCADVRASDPVPGDRGSDWYIPAMDELELLHRHFKPGTDSIDTSTQSGDFPDGSYPGWGNPSSDPQGVSYATDPPTQTSLAAFQVGGAEAMDFDASARYWSATEASSAGAWRHVFRGGVAGRQDVQPKTADQRCRLVRRVPF